MLTDLGYYKTIESGNGFGIMGVGIQGGVVLGDKDTLSGTSYNTNASGFGVSGTVTTDGKGNVIAVSGGPGANIGGVSRTEANTTATSYVTGSDGGTVSVDTMGNSTGSSQP